jgi:hypothetical protein
MKLSSGTYERNTSNGGHTAGKWTMVEIVNMAVVLLLISPWMFRYTDTTSATITAVVTGLLLGAATITRAIGVGRWQGWASLTLGACALLGPWRLGFGEVRNAAGMHVTAGLVVLTMALIDLWGHYLEQPASPA